MDTVANQKVSCIVNYAYDASEPDELTVRPGDILRDVERLPGGWWRGELRGRRGMFPDNFVSILTEHNNARSGGVQGRCRAVFSYQPANPDELALCVGDVIEVLGEVEEGWWQGRRAGRVGVFPSNFVVMLEPPPAQPAPSEPAPVLPPKPIKEQCRVLFNYAAVNDDELSLSEGEVVNIVSKDAPDRGWWRGELHGKVGLFPDNFVQLLPAVVQDLEEKKPERPPPAKTCPLYPILNKYTEKTTSLKELTTSKVSIHKENVTSKDNSTHSTVTHTNKNETEKTAHSETVNDGTLERDAQGKKPPVPSKKSPSSSSSVSGLFSGIKNKMLSSSEKLEKQLTTSPTPSANSSGEWDRLDGAANSKPTPASTPTLTPNPTPTPNTNTFDHIERNSILNDPRAGRVKAPRRRPPSQALRDDTPAHIGLTNGHEGVSENAADKTADKVAERAVEKTADKTVDKTAVADKAAAAEEIKPRSREWEKHRAPWMEELKLNQAKKTLGDGRPNGRLGSTDRILECGLEERKSHSMEMSKSTSSISNRISLIENVETSLETKSRQSLETRKEAETSARLQSPTAAGRTLTTMLDEIKKPPAPSPPSASARSSENIEKSPIKLDKSMETKQEATSTRKFSVEKASYVLDKSERLEDKSSSTVEMRIKDKDGSNVLIAQLNDRILNLEKLIEVQNAKFNAAIEDLTNKLKQESEKRQALQAQVEKLSHCVTQV